MAEQYLVSKKYHEISMLAGEITNRVCKNGDEWTKYLTTAARLYQYPFEDQLMIYAQKGRGALPPCDNGGGRDSDTLS